MRKWIGNDRVEFSCMVDLSKIMTHSTAMTPMVASLSVRKAWAMPLRRSALQPSQSADLRGRG